MTFLVLFYFFDFNSQPLSCVPTPNKIVIICVREIYIEEMKKELNYYFLGVVMGRLRVPDQLDSNPRLRPDDLWTLLSSDLRRLLHRLRPWDDPVDANLIRRIPAGSDLRAHAGKSILKLQGFLLILSCSELV